MGFIFRGAFSLKINAQVGQGARTGAAMEAARLESGGVWRWLCGFFAKPVTISRNERAATLL
jgi:hypothetical protein